MKFQLHVPQPPEQPPQLAVAPVIYVSEAVRWEYKQLVHDLEQEGLPDEEALNRLGKEGWELAAALAHEGHAYLIFKRISS